MDLAQPKDQPWTIVLAAGEGTRLRSLTEALHGRALPKQFADIHGGQSLLEATLARVGRWSPADRTVMDFMRHIEGQVQARNWRAPEPQLQIAAE